MSTLEDRGPRAAPTTSTVSGAEQRAFVLNAGQTEATRLLFAAGEAVAAHLAAGKGTGPEYEALTKVWRQRQAEWRQAMLAEGVNA